MKNLILIILLMCMLSSCSLFLATTSYPISVDAIKLKEGPSANYFLMAQNENQDDFVKAEVERYIEQTLLLKGMKRINSFDEKTPVIIYQYGMQENLYEVRKVYPIQGITGTTSNVYGNRSSTDINRGIVGYGTYEDKELKYDKGLALGFFMLDKDGSVKERYWRVILKSRTKSNDLRGEIPFLLSAGQPYIGKNTNGAKKISVDKYNSTYKKLVR